MSTRTPSTWNLWPDEEALLPRHRIIETAPDDVVDDLMYLLDCQQVVLIDVFMPFDTTSATFVEVTRWHTYGTDDAGQSGNEFNYDCYARLWRTGADAQAEVRINGTSNGNFDDSPGALTTSPAWYPLDSDYLLMTPNTQEDITLSIRMESGGDSVVIGGILIIKREDQV